MWFAHLPSMEIYHSKPLLSYIQWWYNWHSNDEQIPQWSRPFFLLTSLQLQSFQNPHTCLRFTYLYHHHHFEPLKAIFRVNSTNGEENIYIYISILLWATKIGHYPNMEWLVTWLLAFHLFHFDDRFCKCFVSFCFVSVLCDCRFVCGLISNSHLFHICFAFECEYFALAIASVNKFLLKLNFRIVLRRPTFEYMFFILQIYLNVSDFYHLNFSDFFQSKICKMTDRVGF